LVRVLVVRAEMGRVVESRVGEGELVDVVRECALRALSEWDPGVSDFVVIREFVEFEVEGSLGKDAVEALRGYGFIEESGESVRVKLPVYTISFDSRALSDDVYLENKLYLVTIYVNDDLKAFFEAEAASMTSQELEPGGIRSL